MYRITVNSLKLLKDCRSQTIYPRYYCVSSCYQSRVKNWSTPTFPESPNRKHLNYGSRSKRKQIPCPDWKLFIDNLRYTNHDRNVYLPNNTCNISRNKTLVNYRNPDFKYFSVPARYIHVSTLNLTEDPKEDFKVLDDKNKIEEYIEHKRKKLEHKEKLRIASQKFQDAFIFKVDRSLVQPQMKSGEVVEKPVKKSLMERFIHEVKHYYNGFRLLYLDVKIAARLLFSVLNGKSLSRRERKQFLRTVADLFRLVPFSVFIIVPFMEFLLPVAIALFPGMLPSTFEDKKSKESKRVASLKMRLQMAEFLQDTIEEIAITPKSKKPSKKLKDFADFVTKVRSEGEAPSNTEIMKYSKLFEDEITLENIQYDQLKAMCRLLMISPIGTGNFLRFKIKMKLQELKADDQMIRREGIDNLTTEELQNACIARGMRALGVPVQRMKSDLKQWLELSLDEDIPASLLLLSRTLYMRQTTVDEQLKVTIGSLPERLIDEMEVKIGAVEGEAVDRQTIIDIIKHEEEQIKAEKKETIGEVEKKKKVESIDEAEVKEDDTISKEELLQMKETLSTDREELYKIKEDREEYIEDLEELKQVEEKAKENVASKRLGKRIDSMLKEIDDTLRDLENEVLTLPDGKIDKDEDGVVTTQELFEAIQKLRNAPTETKTQRLLEVLDEDKDGAINLEELRKTVELLATEDIDLTDIQIQEVIALLKGTEKIFVIEQIMNKKKTNYILRILPQVYSKKVTDEII